MIINEEKSMIKVKKVLAVLIFSLLILQICMVMVSATTTYSISVSQVEGSAGDIVTVPIVINQNRGFVSLSLTVMYDDSVLTLESVHDTGLLKGSYHTAKYDSPYYLTWMDDTNTVNNTATGTIVELQFKIANHAKVGEYTIALSMNEDDALNANGENVDFAISNGCIMVKEPEHECTFGVWKKYSSRKHIRYCTECDEYETQSHNWDDGQIITEATHEDDGEILYTCEDCGATKTKYIDAEGHDYGSWVKYNAEMHRKTCSCGAFLEEQHNWNSGVVTKEPTATTTGIKTYTCESCKATKTEVIRIDTIPVSGIQLDKTSMKLTLGSSVRLNATIMPSNATNQNIIWQSSNANVASVSGGLVTANKAGTATITATTEDGAYSAQCVVTVISDPVSKDYFTYAKLSDGTYSIKAKDVKDMPSVVEIPATYNGVPVTAIRDYGFMNCTTITNIKLPDSMKSIGAYAFYGCSNLSNIEISKTTEYIGSFAFYNCVCLTEVRFPGTLVEIGASAFRSCRQLMKFTYEGTSEQWKTVVKGNLWMSDVDLSCEIEYVSNHYFRFTELANGTYSVKAANVNEMPTVLSIPDVYNGKAVTEIADYGFMNCSSLKKVKIPDGIVKIGGYAFYACSELSVIDIPSTVTSMGSFIFYGCNRLSEINVASDNPYYKSVDGNLYSKGGTLLIQYAVAKSDVEFKIPNGTRQIGDYAFYGVSHLQRVFVPLSINSLGASSFRNCSLTRFCYEGTKASWNAIEKGVAWDSGTSYEVVFDGVDDSLFVFNRLADGTYSIKAVSKDKILKKIKIPSEYNGISVTAIADYAFMDCETLVEIEIPEGIKTIGAYAFYNSTVEIIKIPASVTDIYVTALYNTSNLTNIMVADDNMFYKSVEGVLYTKNGKTLIRYTVNHVREIFDIPDMVENINQYAFHTSNYLKELYIPSSVKIIGASAIRNCGVLERVIFEGSEEKWEAVEKGSNWIHGSAAEIEIGGYTDDTYFVFAKLPNGTYSIKAANVNNMPSHIKIPPTYNGIAVTAIMDYAFLNCQLVTKITIPEGIRNIGTYAFYGCSNLTDISIPKTTTSIGNIAFYGCLSLQNIEVDSDNPYYKADNGSLYSKGGTYLIQYAVGKVEADVVIPNGVTTIGSYAFGSAYNLNNITIPETIKSIRSCAFRGCRNLKTILFSGTPTRWGTVEKETSWDAVTGNYVLMCNENYTSNGYFAFSLLPNGTYRVKAGNVNVMPSRVKIPATYNGVAVTEIADYAFLNCQNLMILEIPESVAHIGSYAFYGCTKLYEVAIPSTVTSMGSMIFYGCSMLQNIAVAHTNPYYKTVDGNLYSKGGTLFIQYAVANPATEFEIPAGVTTIGPYAFSNAHYLQTVHVPGTVSTIRACAFRNCVNINKFIYSLSNAKWNSIAKESSWDSGMNPYVVDSYNAYTDDTYFSYTLLANGTYSIKAKNIYDMPIDVRIPPTYNGVAVTAIADYAFMNCQDIFTVEIPSGITLIGNYAFYSCSNLTEIVISDTVTSIGGMVLYNCTKLNSIKVFEDNPYYKSVNGNLYSKGGTLLIQYAIGKADTEFVIPTGVTTIGAYAFYGAKALQTIEIPNSVRKFNTSAFQNCSYIQTIIFNGSETNWNTIEKNEKWNLGMSNYEIHFN